MQNNYKETRTTEKSLNSRNLAIGMYSAILNDKIFIEESLQFPAYLNLDAQDKSFVRNLISTTFRYKFKIEYLLNKFVDDYTLPEIKNLLALALCEIIALKTPDYAVVNSYVEIAKIQGLFKFKGLVNAVLKKACVEYRKLLENYDYSNNWLFNLWQKDYGREKAIKICNALEERNQLDLAFKEGLDDKIKNLEQEGIGNIIFAGSLRVGYATNIVDIDGYQSGDFWVQGASSFVAISTLKNIAKDKYVADLCSAPGGKTFLLNSLGAKEVTAFDISSKRLEIMEENLQRLRINYVAVNSDVNTLNAKDSSFVNLANKNILRLTKEDLAKFDVLLLDAPCLATGTIRKHPEVMYLKSTEQLNEIKSVQVNMLNTIAQNMKIGAVLMYANCSLQKLEGETLIDAFLRYNPTFKVMPIIPTEILNHSEFITPEGYLRILPYYLESNGGMEGFFAVRLVKTA